MIDSRYTQQQVTAVLTGAPLKKKKKVVKRKLVPLIQLNTKTIRRQRQTSVSVQKEEKDLDLLKQEQITELELFRVDSSKASNRKKPVKNGRNYKK